MLRISRKNASSSDFSRAEVGSSSKMSGAEIARHLTRNQTSAGNLYRLSLGKIIIARAPLHVDVQLHGIDDPLCRFDHSFSIENLAKASEMTFMRQKNVFVDGYIRNKRLLLEDSGDTEQVRLLVIRRPDLLAPEFDTATVRAHDSRDDIEQSRFAGAVFANNADNAVLRNRKADVIENQRLAELFDSPSILRMSAVTWIVSLVAIATQMPAELARTVENRRSGLLHRRRVEKLNLVVTAYSSRTAFASPPSRDLTYSAGYFHPSGFGIPPHSRSMSIGNKFRLRIPIGRMQDLGHLRGSRRALHRRS